MDLEEQRRKNAYRRLAGSGAVLIVLFIAYIILIRSLDTAPAAHTSPQEIGSGLPVLHTLGSLSLTNQLGEPVGLETFRGKPWFANIIY